MNFRFGYLGFVFAALIVVFSLHQSGKVFKLDQTYDTDLRKKKTKKYLEILDWLSFLGVSCMGILLVFMFFIIPSNVEQNSMYPTLESKDRVIVYHFMYQPKRGDIVVSYMINYGEDEYYVKRIFGMPGDHIEFESATNGDYYIYVNQKRLESIVGVVYTVDQSGVNQILNRVDDLGIIQNGYYLLLGDNANGSTDSRDLGLIFESDIIGKVLFKF